jgi:hypothetical protein
MFVPSTYVPKFRDFRSEMIERVSLLTNKKRYLEVCKYYGDEVLRGNDDVHVILISYGMHGFLLRVIRCKCKWMW